MITVTAQTEVSMAGIYSIERVSGEDITRAFPLLSGVAPQLDLERWRAYCEGRDPAAKGQTAFVARNAAGYVQGLCAFTKVNHLRYGAVVEVPVFLVASVADPRGVADDLLEALSAVCRRENCAGVLVGVKGLDEDVRQRLASRGALDTLGTVYIEDNRRSRE